MAESDIQQARVEYLRLLKEEFTRIWPSGRPRSMEWDEQDALRTAKSKIEKLQRKIDEELL